MAEKRLEVEDDYQDPLDKLFVKSDEVNRDLLGAILIKYLRIDEKGGIFPLPPFFSETNKNKVLLALLARKVIALKLGVEELTAPKDLSKMLDIPDGSLRPTLRELVEERIADEENSKYKIYSQALNRCAEILKEKKEEPTQVLKNKTNGQNKVSMRETVEELSEKGHLDESKTVSEIYALVRQKRPGTTYPALYKVILDLLNQKKLDRELRENAWKYKRPSQ